MFDISNLTWSKQWFSSKNEKLNYDPLKKGVNPKIMKKWEVKKKEEVINPVIWWVDFWNLSQPQPVTPPQTTWLNLDELMWKKEVWDINIFEPNIVKWQSMSIKPTTDYLDYIKPTITQPKQDTWFNFGISTTNANENVDIIQSFLDNLETKKNNKNTIIEMLNDWVPQDIIEKTIIQDIWFIPKEFRQEEIKPVTQPVEGKWILWNLADYWLWLSERIYTGVEDYATDVTNLWLKAFWQEPVKSPREQLFPTWEEYKPWLLWRTVDTTIKTAKDIKKSLNTEWQSRFESWFQWAWKLVWWLVDVFWDTVMTSLSTASPVIVKDTIKEEFKKALESSPWKTALEIWNEFKNRYKYFSQVNPRAGRNLDAIWNIIDWVVNVYWWKLTKTWIDKVDKFWNVIKTKVLETWTNVKQNLKNVWETFNEVWNRIKQGDVEYKFKVWETNPEIITPTKKVNKNYQPEEYAKQIDEQTKAELRQATRPSITWIDTTWKYAKQDEKLLNWVKEVVNQGHTPKTTKEALEKISESKKQIWNNIEETNRKVDIKTNWKDLRDDIYNFIDDTDNDDLFRANPELEIRLKNYADSIETNKRFQDLSQEDLQNLLTDMNSKTPSSKFLQQLDTNPIETQKNIVIANILREKTEKNLMDTLWITNQELRNKYWALRELEKNLAKRYGVFARQNPKWLTDMFSMDALPDMLIWLATGDFKQAWKWFLKKVWAKFIKGRNNPDTIIANIFKKQAELKNPKKWISEKLWDFVANAKWQETEINLKTNFNKDGTKWNTTTSNPNRNNSNILQPTNTNTNNNLNPTIIKPDNKTNLVDNKKTTGDWQLELTPQTRNWTKTDKNYNTRLDKAENKLYEDQLRQEEIIKEWWKTNKPETIADIMAKNPKYAEYKARWDKQDRAIQEIYWDLEWAKAWERIYLESEKWWSPDVFWAGSSFPKYLPDNARTTPIVRAILKHLENKTVPNAISQKNVYDWYMAVVNQYKKLWWSESRLWLDIAKSKTPTILKPEWKSKEVVKQPSILKPTPKVEIKQPNRNISDFTKRKQNIDNNSIVDLRVNVPMRNIRYGDLDINWKPIKEWDIVRIKIWKDNYTEPKEFINNKYMAKYEIVWNKNKQPSILKPKDSDNLITKTFNKKVNIWDEVYYRDQMWNLSKSKFTGYDNNWNARLERETNLWTDLQIIDNSGFYWKLNTKDISNKLDNIIDQNRNNVFLVEAWKMDLKTYREWLKIENIVKQIYNQPQTFLQKTKDKAEDIVDKFAEKVWAKTNFMQNVDISKPKLVNKLSKADLEDFSNYIDNFQKDSQWIKRPSILTNKQTEALKGQISNRILKNEANQTKQAIIQGNKQITNTYLDSVKRQKIKSIGEKLTEFVKKNILPSEKNNIILQLIEKIKKM